MSDLETRRIRPDGYVPSDGRAFKCPAFAARSVEPITVQARQLAARIFENRRNLRNGVFNQRGDVIVPAYAYWHRRPGESAPDFERRRSDGMQAQLSVWVTQIACAGTNTLETMDPKGGYLGNKRLAELAELSSDQTERALRLQRAQGFVSFTKQFRERKPDGKCRSSGPALRRLSADAYRSAGGAGYRLIWDNRRKNRRRYAEQQKRAAEAAARRGPDADRLRELTQELIGGAVPYKPKPAQRRAGRVPEELKAEIQAEHPDWDLQKIMLEAYRRLGFNTS